MHIWRDLAPVADLIQMTFADELRIAGHSSEEIIVLKRLAPLLAVVAMFSPQVRRSLTGFVWEEDGRVVGNVSITQANDPQVWMIGNVAVHPDYRRRGIARRLTELAVEYCRDRRASSIVLEVRRDNEAAYKLYQSMGFVLYDSTTRLQRRGVPLTLPPKVPAGLSLRPERSEDRPQIEQLMRQTMQQEVAAFTINQHLEPRRSSFGRALGSLVDIWNGRRIVRLVLEQSGCLIARLLVVVSLMRTPHRLTLLVGLPYRGQYEHLLVQSALTQLPENPQSTILAEIRSSHEETIAALKASGFETVEILDALILRSPEHRTDG